MDTEKDAGPCYVCGRPTTCRTRRAYFVDHPGTWEDGLALLPGTPVCNDRVDDGATCADILWTETSAPAALAEKIQRQHVGHMRFAEDCAP